MFDDLYLSESRDRSIQWARRLLAERNFVILDTETTGLNGLDQIVEIAVVDANGKLLLRQFVNPTVQISEGAEAVHSISKAMVKEAPAFKQIIEPLLALIAGKIVVTYNATFDIRMIKQSAWAHKVEIDLTQAVSWDCAMEAYAAYYGDYNAYRGSFRWQKLIGGDHSALGDCMATLALIKRMAEDKLTVEK